MRGWNGHGHGLGVVETIYEEESELEDHRHHRHYSPSLLSLSASNNSFSSPTPDLHSRVEAWTLETGCKPDVSIRVQDTHFHLHKDPITSRSGYLKRHLTNTDVSNFKLAPPLKITAETFRLVAEFSYGTHIVITPFNVVSLATAAALLEMTTAEGDGDDEDLRNLTETYFHQYVSLNLEYILVLFRTCLGLLPEAAFLLSRCIEACGDDGAPFCFDDVVAVSLEDFQTTVCSMHPSLTNHDLLYGMIDIYLKEHGGKISEEVKTQLCTSLDCAKLSPDVLVHAVQNPRMPLRLIIRAMLMEQLRTRHSIISTYNYHHFSLKHNTNPKIAPLTLGAILHRDAALRQAVQLKATMDATNSRIQSLEKELHGIKQRLVPVHGEEQSRSVVDTGGRCASFHYISSSECGKIERGERGSSSALSLRRRFAEDGGGVGRDGESTYSEHLSPRFRQSSIRERLISGFKHAFSSMPSFRSKEQARSNLSK